MAASPTPRPTRAEAGPNPALTALRRLRPSLPVAVAFSGGADSTALLLAAARLWPGQVHAIHVHHGLQPAADGFARHCENACRALGVPLRVARVDARHAPGESPEDAARKARYRTLAQEASALGMKSVWLAQHADDQAETLLLALGRGAGLPGLAAMPARFERDGMVFERPLLEVSGAALRDWLAGEGVDPVQDPSNADLAYTRNRIRHALMPALETTFPQFRETFARSARHAAQAQALLEALAQRDWADLGAAPVIAPLQKLARDRQANVLRYWLRSGHGAAASAAQLDELLDQVAACTTRGHRIRIKVGGGFVQRRGERLVYEPSL